jgi:hypothetical protein
MTKRAIKPNIKATNAITIELAIRRPPTGSIRRNINRKEQISEIIAASAEYREAVAQLLVVLMGLPNSSELVSNSSTRKPLKKDYIY